MKRAHIRERPRAKWERWIWRIGDRTIQRHERLLPSRREMMNRQRKQFLSRAAFAQQQAGGVRRRDFLDLLADLADRLMFSHDPREAVAHRVLRTQQQILAL